MSDNSNQAAQNDPVAPQTRAHAAPARADRAQFCVGIDLGTTNSVLAYARLDDLAPGVEVAVDVLPIPQLVAAGTVEQRGSLASFAYLPAEAERVGKSFALPWDAQPPGVVGELARRQSADVPTRTVVAAKSWLCHSRVDRHQQILPPGAPSEVEKISPIEASRRYLAHLAAAWNAAMPESPLTEQQVVLTVPASFDASARELTRAAAFAAGLPDDFVLLEEPQAAVYAWLAERGERWRRELSLGDTLLVCDVGGGTSDFTLIGVAEENGELVLRRMAVGNHLLLGGDNMDLALAHHAAEAFKAKGVTLDPWQSVALWHSCRAAKELLLAADGPSTHPITVLGRGSRLIGGTISVDLQRDEVAALVTDGFFPHVALADRPARRAASGFRELGLPFEADAAITKHLAAFLASQGVAGSPARPTHVLFNGGVFKAPQLRERLLAVLGGWFAVDAGDRRSARAPQSLAGHHDLDSAVARGAAYYGLAKRGRGVRIRGGTARSYYVGFETAGLAIPGAPRPLRALCVVPIGMEEGAEADVPGSEIGLVVGEPANFRFFSSSTRRDDRPGDVRASWTEDEITETDSLEATLPSVAGADGGADENADGGYVPVRFHSRVTELGVLELWCVSATSDQRWKLEFSVREDAEAPARP